MGMDMVRVRNRKWIGAESFVLLLRTVRKIPNIVVVVNT